MVDRPITVIGAANVDIGGKPEKPLIPRDSNPGHVTVSLGGVGRNIAHNLSLLGCRVRFLSAIGEDAHARHIVESSRELGIDLEDCLRTDQAPTSTYLFIARNDGDMELAISDMSIIELLTPEFVRGKINLINDSSLVVVDANLSAETIREIVTTTKVPVFAETVSVVKAEKFKDVLPFVHTITPNALEAEALTGQKIDVSEEHTIASAADALLEKGVRQVVITLGARGAYYADGSAHGVISPLPSKMVNGTGAGDALLSGLAVGFLQAYDFPDAVRLGMAAASTTLESAATNSPELNFLGIARRAGVELKENF